MIGVAIVCAAIGALSCVIFGVMCIRPALRLRGNVQRLQAHPALRSVTAAQGMSESISLAAAGFDSATRRLEVAASSIVDAMASVAGYAGQVASTAAVVESLLGLVVPRLRGMLR
jgi:hypothetical protein